MLGTNRPYYAFNKTPSLGVPRMAESLKIIYHVRASIHSFFERVGSCESILDVFISCVLLVLFIVKLYIFWALFFWSGVPDNNTLLLLERN